MERGFFIVFEGCDHSGKTTQCKLLSESGIFSRVRRIAFPDRSTAIGSMINSYLNNSSELSDEAIHLLFSANRWEAAERISELLNSGTTVICDRYCYSGIAYSAAKGLKLDWCRAPDRGLPAPDLVIFIDAPVEYLQKRGGFGGERYEHTEFQERVHQMFTVLQEENWVTVDGARSLEEVQREVISVVRRFVACARLSQSQQHTHYYVA